MHPWPLPDACVIQAICSHVVEHIPPTVVTDSGTRFPFIEFMDEVWRIMMPDGQFAISLPYGTSAGMLQDPTHVNFCNENCVTSDTEILTADGFKKIIEVTINDEVLSLNPESGISEYLSGCKLTSFDHNGSMIHFTGRAVDMMTNENHRMWYSTRKLANKNKWQFGEAVEFLTKNPKTTVFSSKINFDGVDLITWSIPKVKIKPKGNKSIVLNEFPSEDFAEFMGWWLSEGSVEVTHGKPSYFRVRITQTKPKNIERIMELVKRLGFNPLLNQHNIVFSAYTLAHWLEKFGHCEDKYIPKKLLLASYRIRERLFEALIAGDGNWIRDGKQFRYTTLSKRLADDVQELAMKQGWRASVTNSQKTEGGKTIYRVHGSRYSDIYANHFEKVENYKGRVHSLIMPRNHIYMARRNGKCMWTGNTWLYFDPLETKAKGSLYPFYRPSPWRREKLFWDPTGNMEVLMVKRREDKSYYE